MKLHRKAALPAALGLILSGGLPAAAQAAVPGWYAGLAYGSTDYNLDDSQVDSAVEIELSSFNAPATSIYTFNDPGSGVFSSVDGSNGGGKVFVGYHFNEWIGVEAFYVDLGNVKSSFTGTVDGGEGLAGGTKTDLSGYGASILATLDFGGGFAGYGRLGAFRWDAKTTGSVTVQESTPFTLSLDYDDKGTNLNYGVGLTYDVWRNITLRVEYERFDYGSNTFDPDHVQLLSFGAAWNFD